MELYDIGMIVVLVAATAWGAYKGMAWQLASLASLVASYFLALRFGDQLAQYIQQPPPWNKFLAMLAIYLVTSMIIWIAFRFVKETIELVKLREFDRQVGALFGAVKGVLLCVIITFFVVTLPPPINAKDNVLKSRSGYYIALLLQRSEAVIPPELHGLLDPYMRKLENELDPSQNSTTPPAAISFGNAPYGNGG
ncbi:MAG TPA: CvpA family protein [Pirellulales bacterium]|jgi:membrane protein required for colicin V production|nr:CvpA family protein [Pirellulales bacterium]